MTATRITVSRLAATVAADRIAVIPVRIIMIPGRITVIRPLPTVGRRRPHDIPPTSPYNKSSPQEDR